MGLFVDQLLNGIGNGAVYASVALALVIIYRTTNVLNFAQGEMAMFSIFVTWWFTERGLPIWAALVASMVTAFVAGAVIERVLIRPVEGPTKNPLNVVIVTLGLFLALNSLAALIFLSGDESPTMPLLFPSGETFGIANATIGRVGVLAVECAVLWLLLQKTKLGLSLRAVASNPESARLLGINPGLMLMVGWAMAAALGALAGTLEASEGLGAFDTGTMQAVLVYAFAAAALGGFDSLLGAVVGGLVVGVANSMTVQYVSFLDGIEILVPFALILIVLLVRPNGLFGRTVVERV